MKPELVKTKPGHSDVLGGDEKQLRPMIVSLQVSSILEAVEFALDNGLWFACYTNGCIAPETLLAGVKDGRKLWQILQGDPTVLSAQGQMNQSIGDIVALNLIDPNHAIAMLEKRAGDAQTVANRIRQELAKE